MFGSVRCKQKRVTPPKLRAVESADATRMDSNRDNASKGRSFTREMLGL